MALDVLRFVAVFGVFGAHMPALKSSDHVPTEWLYRAWGKGGGVGVWLFFVLSGFLVAGLLFNEFKTRGSADVPRFLIRRAFKIYPAFWFYTAALVAMLWWRGEPILWPQLGYELAFVQNYGGCLWGGHTWTLAVEEHFYLLVALLIWFLIRRGGENPFHSFPFIALSMCVFVLALRSYIVGNFPHNDVLYYKGTHAVIDALVFGSLLAYSFHFHHDEFNRIALRYRPVLLVGGIIALCLPRLAFTESAFYSYGFTVIYLGSGALLAALVAGGLPNNPLTRAMAKVGTYSYSIYLWHFVTAAWFTPWLSMHSPVWLSPWRFAAVYMLLAVVIGAAASILVEWPMLRLRDRWFPSRGKVLDTTPR